MQLCVFPFKSSHVKGVVEPWHAPLVGLCHVAQAWRPCALSGGTIPSLLTATSTLHIGCAPMQQNVLNISCTADNAVFALVGQDARTDALLELAASGANLGKVGPT